MSNPEVEPAHNNDTVELFIERQAAIESYRAASLAVGAAGSEVGEGQEIEVPFLIFVKRPTAVEFLRALALSLDLATFQNGDPEGNESQDIVEIMIDQSVANSILNALVRSLGSEAAPKVENGKDVVKATIARSAAVDLLNALVINLGPLPSGKGKGGKGNIK